jgi:hypothetical protein
MKEFTRQFLQGFIIGSMVAFLIVSSVVWVPFVLAVLGLSKFFDWVFPQ